MNFHRKFFETIKLSLYILVMKVFSFCENSLYLEESNHNKFILWQIR